MDDLSAVSSAGSKGPGEGTSETQPSGEGNASASPPESSPPSASTQQPLPSPLQVAGFEVDGASCSVTGEHVTPLAAPGNQWTAEIDADCGAGIGRVSIWMKALRDVPYPIACGGWNQLTLAVWDSPGVDGGTQSSTAANAGDRCSITSGPQLDAPETGIAVTAIVKGYSGSNVHTVAYRSVNVP